MSETDSWAARFTRAVGEEIKRHRKAQDWSARELSEACADLGMDFPRSTLADLESGRRAHISVAELLVLARALHVAPLALVFPVGTEDQAEILPGDIRSPFRAAEWFAGLGPYPEPGDDGVVTIPEVYDPAEAGALALYRAADRMYELERRELSRAAGMAASAAVMPDAASGGYMAAADAHRRAAESARSQGEDLRKQAAAKELIPPPAEMSLRPLGDELIV